MEINKIEYLEVVLTEEEMKKLSKENVEVLKAHFSVSMGENYMTIEVEDKEDIEMIRGFIEN